LFDWAYIPDIPKCLQALKELALDEPWAFGKETDLEYPYPILWNYLRYIYLRLHHEKKINESDEIAAFNTGLVDKHYQPIYAAFRPNRNQRGKWKWSSFCIAGEGRDGKDLVRSFKVLPQSADYIIHLDDMIYDVTQGQPEVDWEHIIIENIDRLPLEFLLLNIPAGFQFVSPLELSPDERANFFAELSTALRNDSKSYRAIKNRLVDALDLAIKRTRWNFRTAIPVYYPRGKNMALLLPLALISEEKVDVALVVEKTRSGSYLGHTIYPMDWAYMAARLVSRPDSDWLAPSSINTPQLGGAPTEQENSE
jgi:hypothetical protein